MADVLLVTAREDYIFAEGVAASLEQSGLTVAQTDGYTRSGENAPCILVLWSIASGRSAAIRNMAVRAQHEGRLTAACLAGGEPPLGFSRPRPFDLTQWDGDPNASALDGMFFAIDRIVCAARLNQGQARPPAATVAPLRPHSALNTPVRARPAASVGPPPSARVTQMRTTRTTAPAPQPPHYEEPAPLAASAAPLVNEATAWKRIEHSEDPADFLNYLTEYGPNGLFSELAQLRLDKLSAAKPAPRGGFMQHTPSPHMERERPRPQPAPPSARLRPPPMEEDRWREPPPQERAEPARRQARRRPQAEAVAAPSPVREDSGGFRVGPILAVGALLAAGAAGFHFSRQGGQTGQTEVAAAPTVEAPLDTNDYYANAVQAGPLNAAPARPQAAAPRQAAHAPAPRPRQPAAQDQREVAAYVPPPAVAAAPSISFSPPAPEQAQPTPPPAAVPAPAPSAAPSAAASLYVVPTWISRPTGAQLARVYPSGAVDRNLSGTAMLDCTIQNGGTLTCSIASETPPRIGFGRAAMATVSSFRVSTTGADGESLVGKKVRVPVTFRLSS